MLHTSVQTNLLCVYWWRKCPRSRGNHVWAFDVMKAMSEGQQGVQRRSNGTYDWESAGFTLKQSQLASNRTTRRCQNPTTTNNREAPPHYLSLRLHSHQWHTARHRQVSANNKRDESQTIDKQKELFHLIKYYFQITNKVKQNKRLAWEWEKEIDRSNRTTTTTPNNHNKQPWYST